MPVVSMSKQEFDRLEVVLGVQSGRLRVADACELLGLKRRQVFRLPAGLKHGGAASLVSKRRGWPSNNRLPEAYRSRTSDNARSRYASGKRLLLGLPRRFETRLAAPPCFKPASNRNTWRRFKLSNSQASATRRRPD